MHCTPPSDVYHKSCKNQHCCGILSDSGYSSLFHSPQRPSEVKCDPCRPLSLEELNETPKENLQLSVTPKKEKSKESVRYLDKDFRGAEQPPTGSWCETPKVYKKDASLRRRLLPCKSSIDVKTDNTSPCTKSTESTISMRSEHWLSGSFNSSDTVMLGALASSTLKLELDVPLSGRKRRFFFSQVRTSTLEDGKQNRSDLSSFERKISLSDTDLSETNPASDDLTIETPFLCRFLPALSNENSQTPVSDVINNLCESTSVLSTPSSTHTPKCNRSVCEDSGFSGFTSLTLDKSHDSSVDHDGSFQELLLSASTAEFKRRSRLQRQHRLSTLTEGGSQSEEDNKNINQAFKDIVLIDSNHTHFHQCHSISKEDEVFADSVTPCRDISVISVSLENSMTSVGLTSVTKDYVTPLQTTKAKPENVTPLSAASATQDITPLKTSPADLSLTPALQLVYAMCQQQAWICANQSLSLEEQLNSAAALAKTQVTFRTSMPLTGLIGRKIGLGKVDILTELKKRNLKHILTLILSLLSSEDIYRFAQVCKSWNEIILQDKEASSRRRIHLRDVAAALQLGSAVHVPDAETRLTLVKRSALKTVQAQSRTSSFCSPPSGRSTLTPLQRNSSCPGSSTKRERFLEVAKTLFSDEWLKSCPQCQHPARCRSVKGEGVCSRADCGFQFCTACLCAFHGSRECGSQSAGRRSKKDIILPGSTESKRNLRRL
ncbi:hypothetical protein LDENG_00119290 [Lucifuga dentata]|nr:hypothetical protein LDENG_00119290 [Lucifuga dentata]